MSNTSYHFDTLLNNVNSFNYDANSNRLILRIKLNQEKFGKDDIILPTIVLDFFGNLFSLLCNEDNFILRPEMNRSYYNREIGPQLYWVVTNNSETNNTDILASLGLIEISIFQGNKVTYQDNVISFDDNVKLELDATSNIISVQDFKMLLAKYVTNLFNVDYQVNRYMFLKKDNNKPFITKMTTNTISMIKDDSEMLCQKIKTYNNVGQEKIESLKNNFKNLFTNMRSIKSDAMSRLFTTLDFGNDGNEYLNNVLNVIYNAISDVKELKKVYFPMRTLDFNSIKIIPFYILKSNMTEEKQKKYIGIYAMIHYTIVSKDFTNINNYFGGKNIMIDDSLKNLIKSSSNTLTPKDVQDLFYNFYKESFKNLLMYAKK
jgi:hypothetical protein